MCPNGYQCSTAAEHPSCCGLKSHSGLCQSKTLMHLYRQEVFPENQSEWVEKKGSPVISVGLSSLEEVLRRGSMSDMPTPPSRHQLGTQRQVFYSRPLLLHCVRKEDIVK